MSVNFIAMIAYYDMMLMTALFKIGQYQVKKLSIGLFALLLCGVSHAGNIIRATAPITYVDPWVAAESEYSPWASISSLYGCSNWAPLPSTVNAGTSFTQLANNCQIDQVRTVFERLKLANSDEYKIISESLESRILYGQVQTRVAIGTKYVPPPSTVTIAGIGSFFSPTKLPDGRVFYLFERTVNETELGTILGIQIHPNNSGRLSRTVNGKTITLNLTGDLLTLFSHIKNSNLPPYSNSTYWTNTWYYRIGYTPSLSAVSPGSGVQDSAGSVGGSTKRYVLFEITNP